MHCCVSILTPLRRFNWHHVSLEEPREGAELVRHLGSRECIFIFTFCFLKGLFVCLLFALLRWFRQTFVISSLSDCFLTLASLVYTYVLLAERVTRFFFLFIDSKGANHPHLHYYNDYMRERGQLCIYFAEIRRHDKSVMLLRWGKFLCQRICTH